MRFRNPPDTRAHILPIVAALFYLVSVIASAQTDSGRVTGTVSDATGAIIPGATITLTDVDTGAISKMTSKDDGTFTFAAVPRGQYKVDISMDGFTSISQSFTLEVSQVQEINAHLQPGGATTVVQVTDAAPLVDTSTSSVGEDIQGRQVTELPLNGRNFTQLALLTPGVTRGNYGNSASGVNGDVETFRNSESGGGSLSTNGLRPQANNFILDGIDNNESLVNTLDFFPNIEGTEEFKVNTSTAPAEFGRAGGAIVQSSIKSGGSQFHGSAFEFGRSSLFDSNPNHGFIGVAPTPVLPFKRNTFGGSVGGPVWKNHVFLFGDYQGVRENQPLNAESDTVPTMLMRQGNFSELLGTTGITAAPLYIFCPNLYPNGPNGTAVYTSGAIYDPLTCNPFPGNIIPSTQLNPAALNYLNAYPLPNTSGTTNGTENNYTTSRVNVTHNNTFDVRADGNLTKSDRAFARFVYDNSNFSRTSSLPNLPAGFASGENYVHGRGYAVGETHIFSPTVINEFRIGYNRYTFANVPVFSGVPISADLGIVNANRNANLGGGALIGGNGNEIDYTGDYGTYAVPENTYEINDAVTIARTKHTFKFGAAAIRREVAYFRPISGKGYFNFASGDSTGYVVSEMLAGFTDYYSIGAQSGFYGTRNYEFGIFGEDDWHATQRLMLNLGLRYDIITWPTEEYNRQAALDPATGTIELAGVNGVPRTIINNNYGNFAPRIGFAYDVFGTGKTVLRGGYGIYYFLDRGGIDNQLGQQVPFGGSVNYTAQQGYRYTFTGAATPNQNSNANATGPLPLPGFPNFNPNDPPAGINVFAVERTEKLPNVQQYDLQLQQQFGTKTIITLGYVGNKTTHLATGYLDNTNPLGTPSTTPNPYPNIGEVVLNKTDGVSHYNSLQAQLNYKATNTLIFTSSYTWAHNIDDTDGYLDFYAVSPIYVYNHALNKGNSTLDQRNVFVASALYTLPFGRGQMFANHVGRGLDMVIGGWQLNTIVSAETGSPFSVIGVENFGSSYSLRANEKGGDPVTHSVLSQPYLVKSDFSAPAPGTEGNTGRNEYFGPGLAEGDISLFKTLHFTERFATELRAEVYNVTNTPQFTNPDANIIDGTFGQITGTREYSERQMQMAVRFLF
ncbi:carboxypeptidase regulatory-like domain-containing protein [Acidicapsa acidisoli]|uniref:carboxypeptidase regulatory-like domain-containing protein n=1 Tax=Acidicapsa acidisoli TaxID=1615681 RepID=UPI0021DFAB00|nr:carboxypeptidase regulatory-like domain-containing protein [Acidicapsa acidisoli]